MKCDKNKAINIIVNAAENYRKYLQNKVFLIRIRRCMSLRIDLFAYNIFEKI